MADLNEELAEQWAKFNDFLQEQNALYFKSGTATTDPARTAEEWAGIGWGTVTKATGIWLRTVGIVAGAVLKAAGPPAPPPPP